MQYILTEGEYKQLKDLHYNLGRNDTLRNIYIMITSFDDYFNIDKTINSDEYYKQEKIGNPLLSIISNIKCYIQLVQKLKIENPKLLNECTEKIPDFITGEYYEI